jgi:hypothetical protein
MLVRICPDFCLLHLLIAVLHICLICWCFFFHPGDGLLALATDHSYEIVRASDGSSVGANFSVIYGSESTFIYNPTQRRLLSLSLNYERTLHAISASELAKIEWTLQGTGGLARGVAGVAAVWDNSAPVAVDAAGRIIVTGTDAFYVFGMYFTK